MCTYTDPAMTNFAFGLLGFVLLVLLTAAVGGVLDLPSLSAFRVTLAERRVKPWAVLVAASPLLSAVLNIPGRVAALAKLPLAQTTWISLIGGAFFTAALAGCWLAMDEAQDPHSRPKGSIMLACVVLALDAVLLHYFGKW